MLSLKICAWSAVDPFCKLKTESILSLFQPIGPLILLHKVLLKLKHSTLIPVNNYNSSLHGKTHSWKTSAIHLKDENVVRNTYKVHSQEKHNFPKKNLAVIVNDWGFLSLQATHARCTRTCIDLWVLQWTLIYDTYTISYPQLWSWKCLVIHEDWMSWWKTPQTNKQAKRKFKVKNNEDVSVAVAPISHHRRASNLSWSVLLKLIFITVLPAVASGLSVWPPDAVLQPLLCWDPPDMPGQRRRAPLGRPSVPSSPCRSACPSANAAPAARPEQPVASPRPCCGPLRLQQHSSSPQKNPSCSACCRRASIRACPTDQMSEKWQQSVSRSLAAVPIADFKLPVRINQQQATRRSSAPPTSTDVPASYWLRHRVIMNIWF